MIAPQDLERLVKQLPKDLRDGIDIEEAKHLEGEDEEVFRENVEYLIAADKKNNKSASVSLQYNPLSDTTVGFGAYFGFTIPLHEGLHAAISVACGGKVYGIEQQAGSIGVLSHEPNAMASIATGLAPHVILTPIGLYFVKEGIKEKDSMKLMFGAVNMVGTIEECLPLDKCDFARVAAILSDYIHVIPEGALKAGLITGVLASSYGLVKAAEYAKGKAK